MLHEFSFPTRVVYGAGGRRRLPEFLSEWAGAKPLLVTDPGLVEIGLHRAVTDVLAEAGIAVPLFDGVDPNPVEANVNAGAAVYREEGCGLLIGLGGGSALDVAKAIALRVSHDLPLVEYDENREGWKKTHPNVPPVIAIPTTAGTGSEVGRSAVITLAANERKTVLFSPYLMPKIALLDPELTVGLPRPLTAATGMDAFTHSLEAYLSTNFHPFCDAVALHGIRLCNESLPRAVAHGDDLEARGTMLIAAAMGATAFQKGLGVTHSLAHPLSTLHGIHHGLANAILLPYTVRWNADAARDKLVDVARSMRLAVDGRSAEAVAAQTVEAIEALCRTVGIPPRLSDVGIRAEHLPALVAKAMEDGCRLTNPRPTTQHDLEALYREAL